MVFLAVIESDVKFCGKEQQKTYLHCLIHWRQAGKQRYISGNKRSYKSAAIYAN
jgi:hypothetical protein